MSSTAGAAGEPDRVIYVRNAPNGSKAMTTGIVALCLSWLPFVGLILGILAFIYAQDGLKSQDSDVRSKSLVGLICGAIAVMWPIVIFGLLIIIGLLSS